MLGGKSASCVQILVTCCLTTPKLGDDSTLLRTRLRSLCKVRLGELVSAPLGVCRGGLMAGMAGNVGWSPAT